MDGKLFVNITRMLTPTYNELIQAYSEGDCCMSYLSTFELVLSACLRDDVLEHIPYFEKSENTLHTHTRYSKNSIIPEGEFWLWLKTYEQIMRDEGLIGNSGDEDAERNRETAFLDGFIAPHVVKVDKKRNVEEPKEEAPVEEEIEKGRTEDMSPEGERMLREMYSQTDIEPTVAMDAFEDSTVQLLSAGETDG